MDKTFANLVVGDYIYEVDSYGNIKKHQIKSIDVTQYCYIVFRWGYGISVSIPRKDFNVAFGFGCYFSSFYHADKTAKNRRKKFLKDRIKDSEKLLNILKDDIASLKKELQSLS